MVGIGALLVLGYIASFATGLRQSSFTQVSQIWNNWLEQAAQTDTIRGRSHALLVRWAFHDAVTWDPQSNTGGAHACLAVQCPSSVPCEFNAAYNGGLQSISVAITKLYQQNQLSSVLSLADFAYLGAKLAIEAEAIDPITIGYQWGRTDCSLKAPSWPGRIPDAAGGQAEINRVLKNRIGLSDQEVVIALGAHSIGGAQRQNTGYQGQWTKNPNEFGNTYYNELRNSLWKRQVIPPLQSGGASKQQWTEPGQPGHMMLNVDTALVWQVANSNCNITGTSTDCPLSSTSSLVQLYANSNSQFNHDFAIVFQKLSSWGTTGLRQVCSDSDSDPSCD